MPRTQDRPLVMGLGGTCERLHAASHCADLSRRLLRCLLRRPEIRPGQFSESGGSEPIIMSGLSLILQTGLACVLIVLALLSLQLLSLCVLRRFWPVRALAVPALPDSLLPHVLVQLPVC